MKIAAVGVTTTVVAVEIAMVDVVAEAEAVTMTADAIKARYPSRYEVCM